MAACVCVQNPRSTVPKSMSTWNYVPVCHAICTPGYNVTPMQVCFNQTFKKLHKHEGYQVTTTTVEQIFSSSRYTNKHSLKL